MRLVSGSSVMVVGKVRDRCWWRPGAGRSPMMANPRRVRRTVWNKTVWQSCWRCCTDTAVCKCRIRRLRQRGRRREKSPVSPAFNGFTAGDNLQPAHMRRCRGDLVLAKWGWQARFVRAERAGAYFRGAANTVSSGDCAWLPTYRKKPPEGMQVFGVKSSQMCKLSVFDDLYLRM